MVDQGPSALENELVSLTRRFAAEVMRPAARRAEREEVPPAILDQAKEIGFDRLRRAPASGGLGLDRATVSAIDEALAFGDPGIAISLIHRDWSTTPPPASSGDLALVAALQDGRVDLAFDSRARFETLDDGRFRLDGRGGCATFDARARLVLLAASNEIGKTTWFLLPIDTPGLATIRIEALGLRAMPLCRVELQDCVASPDRAFSDAWAEDLERELRVRISALLLGTSRASFEYAREYAEQRIAFGKPIAHHQAIAFMLADVHMEIEAGSALTLKGAATEDRTDADCALLQARRAAWLATDAGVQILGGAGFITDHPVERWFRDAQTLAALTGLEGELRARIGSARLARDA